MIHHVIKILGYVYDMYMYISHAYTFTCIQMFLHNYISIIQVHQTDKIGLNSSANKHRPQNRVPRLIVIIIELGWCFPVFVIKQIYL